MSHAVLVAVLSLGLGLSACKKKDENAAEKMEEGVKDALDVREHEKLKDAAEEATDAAKDAAEGIKEETKEQTQ
jgi:altronate dehydratase